MKAPIEDWPACSWSIEFVAERHVTDHALVVRHEDLLDLGTPVGDFHHHAVLVLERVEIDVLAVDLRSIPLAFEFHLVCGPGWIRLERSRGKHSKKVAKRG